MAHKELAPGGGKGSADRTADKAAYDVGYERIFGKPKKKGKSNG